MNTTKLENIINMVSGPNSLDIKRRYPNQEIYTQDDLERDLGLGYVGRSNRQEKKQIVQAGDVIVNTMTNKATVVSNQSAGKVQSQQIVRLEFNSEQIDAWYLCYFFNESDSVKRQLHSIMEGTVLRRVTVSNVKNLKIKLPKLEVQQQIGEIYRQETVNRILREQYNREHFNSVLSLLKQTDVNG